MSLTKSTLVALLVSTYEDVKTPELLNTETYNGKTLATYNINCMKVIGNGAMFFNLIFYVLDEGETGEAAYFDYHQEPDELKNA